MARAAKKAEGRRDGERRRKRPVGEVKAAKATKAARAAKARELGRPSADAPLPTGSGASLVKDSAIHPLDVRLTGDWLKQIERLAAEKDVSPGSGTRAVSARAVLLSSVVPTDDDECR